MYTEVGLQLPVDRAALATVPSRAEEVTYWQFGHSGRCV